VSADPRKMARKPVSRSKVSHPNHRKDACIDEGKKSPKGATKTVTEQSMPNLSESPCDREASKKGLRPRRERGNDPSSKPEKARSDQNRVDFS